MNSKVTAAQQSQPSEAAATDAPNFDFDRWAVAVRQQLLASLQKRTARQP